jgi:hypothetical protein
MLNQFLRTFFLGMSGEPWGLEDWKFAYEGQNLKLSYISIWWFFLWLIARCLEVNFKCCSLKLIKIWWNLKISYTFTLFDLQWLETMNEDLACLSKLLKFNKINLRMNKTKYIVHSRRRVNVGAHDDLYQLITSNWKKWTVSNILESKLTTTWKKLQRKKVSWEEFF